ncbi:MAG: TonB-dependent receptor [Crocinitomicaceae bacterium]
MNLYSGRPFHFVVLFFLLSLNQICFSQSTQLLGTIAVDQETLSMGTAAVFQSSDSTLIKGTFLDSNRINISFKSIPAAKYFLRLTIPGYSDTSIAFSAIDSILNLGLITLIKNKELETVDVLYVKEMYVRTLDGLTVNVEGTSLQTLTNLFEVLKASPKITSPDEEAIEIIGRGRPLILVDRQAIISNDELKAIPANQIEKIEIITNPSAKYKAQGSGNGVIEVYTKNFHLEGYNVTVRGGGGLNTKLKPSANLNLGFSLKKKKISLNGYFGGNFNSTIGFGSTVGESTDDSNRGLNTDSDFENRNTWQYYNIKGAYNINDRKRITMGVNGYGSNGSNSSISRTIFTQNDVPIIQSSSTSTNAWTWLNNSAFINYTIETDTNKSNFEVNLNYTNKVSNSDNFALSDLKNMQTTTNSVFGVRNDSRDIPNIGELRINYEHVFDTTGWKFGVGLSYSMLVNGKKLDRFSGQSGNWIIDDSQSNSYDYSENIGATFAELTKNWDKWSVRLGMRAEYTNLYGYSNSLEQEFIDSVYLIPFPSGSVMWQASNKLAMTLFYDSGIDRPQFDNYDPFIVQTDSFNINYGNPFLRPGIENTIGIDFDINYKYNISISYNHVIDPLSSISFIANNSFVTETTPWNAGSEQGLSASFSIPLNTPWLRGWNSIWIDYTRYSFTPIFERETFDNLTFGLYSYLTFLLPKSLEITNRLHINKWGNSSNTNNAVVNWGVRATKKFGGNKYQLFADLGNIIPPKNKRQKISGNYIYDTSYQNQFTTIQIGFFAKFGRLKQASNIEESKSQQSGRI